MAPSRITGRPVPSGGTTSALVRILEIAGVLLVVSFVVLAGAAAFLTSRVTTEHNDVEDVTPASFLLTSTEDVSFTTPNGGEHKGWLLRGLRGAPVILICHGYGTNRSDGLSLGSFSKENQCNVNIYYFLGYRYNSYMS